jgi:tellurite resistance protein
VLSRFDQATPTLKARVVAACVAVALADGRVTLDEAELLRAVSAAVGLPIPVLGGGGPG